MTTNWVPLPEEADKFCDVFIDESSQTGHRYLVLGALVIPYTHVDQFNADIIAARNGTKIQVYKDDGTFKVMKWDKVSKYSLDAYKAAVTATVSFKRRHNMSTLKDMGVHCVAVDTSARPLQATGEGNRDVGYDKELYFLCTVSVANRYRDKLFHLYPDRRDTAQPLKESMAILNHGVHKFASKKGGSETYPFRRLKFGDPETCLGLQVVDIFIGAMAYKLNRHYEKLDANPAKKELCDHIWSLCKIEKDNPFVTLPYQTKRFMTWLHRPQAGQFVPREWSKVPSELPSED